MYDIFKSLIINVQKQNIYIRTTENHILNAQNLPIWSKIKLQLN